VPVPSLRRRVQPCPKDLTAYLYATYHCIKGTTLVLKLRGCRPSPRPHHSGVCTWTASGIREGPQNFGWILCWPYSAYAKMQRITCFFRGQFLLSTYSCWNV